MQVLLLPVILIAWLLAIITPAGRLALEDEMNGVSEDRHRGTSIMPVFPFLPIIIWGVGWLGASYISPQIPSLLLVSHLILMVVSALVIVRDVIRLRRLRARIPKMR
jgi:hypothetical protein